MGTFEHFTPRWIHFKSILNKTVSFSYKTIFRNLMTIVTYEYVLLRPRHKQQTQGFKALQVWRITYVSLKESF